VEGSGAVAGDTTGSGVATAVAAGDGADTRLAGVVRDIARGGLVGLIVGIVVCGIGGRLVMRLAALLVPAATGLPTENGNRIGDITLGGTMGLVVFAGLLGAIAVGVTWTVVSPWLPGRGVVRGLVAAPIAVALGSFALIVGDNPDFPILRHDPLVVASLLLLVGSTMPAAALVDGRLDRRLPRPASLATPVGLGYLAFAGLGGVVAGLPFVSAAFGGASEARPLALTVVLVGFVTIAWWRERLAGRTTPSPALRLAAWSILAGGTIFGLVTFLPQLLAALGLR
jgi:hypothetical protein